MKNISILSDDEIINKDELLYKKLFLDYIIKKLKLNEYDEKLNKSDLNYISISLEDKDNYQKNNSRNLKYFYIRNNMYIERLTQEDIKFIQNKRKNSEELLDEEWIKFIESTYPKIIKEETNRNRR